MPQWDLYNTQPFKIYGPIQQCVEPQRLEEKHFPSSIEEAIAKNHWRAVAGVTYTGKNSFVWWNADYLISSNMSGGIGGSGFGNYPYDKAVLEFDEEHNMWFWSEPETDNFGRKYITAFYFALLEPDKYEKDRDALRMWDAYGEYCPSLEKLRKMALHMYADNPECEKIRAEFIRKNAGFIKKHPYYLADKEK